LFAKDICRSPWGDPAIEPPITPINKTKAIHFAVISRSLDQALFSSPFAAPDARECWMKGKLHLILEIEIRQVGGKLIPQISLDEIMDGQRFGCCGTGQQNLYPQAFPT
jgi:hypothetical protein